LIDDGTQADIVGSGERLGEGVDLWLEGDTESHAHNMVQRCSGVKYLEDRDFNALTTNNQLVILLLVTYESSIANAPTKLFKTLSDPTRRAIFEQLIRDGEQNVKTLTVSAGISQPAVSKHLSILKHAGLVQERPQGRAVHYSADPAGLAPLEDWLKRYGAFWTERLDRLEQVLDGMDK
jgi:DNA-binding transcriptional ArsR family regulator